MAPTLAVLGAGYAGLAAFRHLQEHLRPGEAELVLVNRDRYHTFTTQIHTIAGDGADPDHVRVPLHHVVRPPARLIVAPVERLEPEVPAAVLRTGRLRCDAMVVALGFVPEYYGLPGVREHSYPLANLQSAARLRERLRELAAAPAPGRRAAVVVAGGGLTGVELVTEIADTYPGRFRLVLVEGGSQIMPGFDPLLVHAARAALRARGVEVAAGRPITAAEAGSLVLADGRRLPFDVLVWAGGIRGNPVVAASGLAVTPKGQARTDPYLRAVGRPAIFLAGDCSAPTDPRSGRPVPATAQAAIQEGRAAAQNLLRQLRGEEMVPFRPRLRGVFISLGRREGVGKIGFAHVFGGPALIIKHLIEAHHAYEVGGLRELAALLGRPERGRPRPPLAPADGRHVASHRLP